MAFEPGDTFDRYRLEALIGEGGMGRVFRAFDPKLRRRVAIKILPPQKVSDESKRVERVFREAQAAAALDHPGVVAVFDVSEADGHPFIVMEFVEGQSLRSFIGVEQVPMRERIRWVTDIARALAAAHRVGLVHRDIKPENVMIREDGAIKLLDFGIARRLDGEEPKIGSTNEGGKHVGESSMAGTPCYMAPEQVQRKAIDGRADQFAWAVMAYELFTGELPWQSLKKGVPTSIAVVTEKAPALSTEMLGLSPHIGIVVARALEKSPARRFDSMDALLAELEGDAAERPLPILPAPAKIETNATARDTQEGMHTEVAVPDRTTSPNRETPTLRRSWHRRSWFAMAVFGLVAVGAFWVRNRSTHAPETPMQQGSVSAPEMAASADTWQPSAQALAAYEEGNRRIQNGAFEAGMEHFEEAIEYEPGYAAAYLRLAIARLIDGPHPAGSEEFLAASRLRRRLNARDVAILEAFVPSFENDPPQIDKTIAQLADLEKRFSEEPDWSLFRPSLLVVKGRDDEAAPLLRSFTQRFPHVATPHLGLAYIYGRRDKLDEARRAVETCQNLAKDAVDCVWLEAKLDAYMGQCKAMQTAAERWEEIKPNDQGAIAMQVDALIAQRVPPAVIDKALADAASEMPVESHARITRLVSAMRLILEGQFSEADQILVQLPNQTRFDNAGIIWLNELRVALREEMGDIEEAAAIAKTVLARKKTLPHTGDMHVEGIEDDGTMAFQHALLAAGIINETEFATRRNTWMNAWHKRGATHNERALWVRGYANTARTPEAAREALRMLEPLGKPRRFIVDRLLVVDTARVYVLAERFDDAWALLEEACASCLVSIEPLRFVQAHALLGRVREARGEVEPACKAYRMVLEHWGKARPSSITAREVKARSQALGCKFGF